MGIVKVWKDERGWRHIDWELRGVTVVMLDWWFCNMDRGYELWQPEDHKYFRWIRKPKQGWPIGALQETIQKFGAGPYVKDYIRWEDVETAPDEIKSIIVYDHVVVAGLVGLAPPDQEVQEAHKPLSYVIHQWEATEFGVRGRSTGALPPEEVENWAQHAQIEQSRLEEFLPQLYMLWSVIKDPEVNPQCCFKVVREGNIIRYAFKTAKRT